MSNNRKKQPTNTTPANAPKRTKRFESQGDGLLDQFDDDILRQSWESLADKKEQERNGHKNIQPTGK